ncbi:MAG: M3 family metallopeptidase, partial [Myxococcota bacterium]
MRTFLATFVLLGFACAHTVSSEPQAAQPHATPTAAKLAKIDVPWLRHTWTPAELTAACEKAEAEADAAFAKLIAQPDDKRTFASSFGAADATLAHYLETTQRLVFMKHVHTDAKVRGAAGACEERMGKYLVQLGARKDLYLAMKGYLAHAGKAEALDAEKRRLIEVTMRDFRRNGLELPDEKRAQLVKIRSRLAELETQFSTRLNEDKTTFTVTAAELEGLPEDFIARHKQPAKKGAKEELYVLTTKYPDYFPVMENARREATRRKMEVAFMNRGGKENLALLNEAVELRAKAAQLLGYTTHVDFVAEDRMAKDARTITAFLTRMREGLKAGLAADTAKMQALKAADTKDPKAVIHAWDWRYYLSQIKKKDYALDDQEVRRHFPAQKVVGGMFEVYERLFGIEISEVPNAEVWANGVKLYEVREAPGGELVARFYIDFYPREGKYGHAAEFGLSSGRAVESGYRIPLAALVLNFNPPAKEGEPAYLSVKEVDTLFHEFGHVMHESLTTARFATLSGTNTARDFVEAPSQMLENWVYRPEVLSLISQDVSDPKKPLPDALAQRIIKARKFDAGVHYSRQLFLGTFDATIHTAQKTDADAAAKRLWGEIMGFPEDPAAHFAQTFGHMMGGYDGGYYGYLWSEVFAADMFTRFSTEGVLNPKTGRAYRDSILARGRTVNPDELLEQFLGRAPNEEAFLVQLGLKK